MIDDIALARRLQALNSGPLSMRVAEALNTNEYGPGAVPLRHDRDIVIGPLTFRYGGGPKRNRWYLVPVTVADLEREESNT